MENSGQSLEYATKKSKKPLLVLVILLLVLGVAAIVGVFIFNKNQMSDDVKATLLKASSAMTEASKDGGGYPSTLPYGQLSTKTVKLDGTTSFDGTSYCIVGSSLKDQTVVYHIDSTLKEPATGTCESASNLESLQSTGDLIVSVVSSDRIGFSWRSVPRAVEYTLQCATNMDFAENLVTVTSKSLTGFCGGLVEGKTYYSRVKANNQSIVSDWSPVSTNTTATR
jgi:hypothetical protein